MRMKKILHILRNTDQPMRNYVLKAALISLFPSLAISAVVTPLMPGQGPTFEGPPVAVTIVGILILSPWLETILLWGLLWIIKRFIVNPTGVAIISAMVWGGCIPWRLRRGD